MPTMIDTSKWIGGEEAAAILTRNSGHEISSAYVRRLAKGDQPPIRKLRLHGRLCLYNKRDVEGYRVKKKKQKMKDLAEVLSEPWRVDVAVRVISEKFAGDFAKKLAEERGTPLDEQQLAQIAEETRAQVQELWPALLQDIKETGEIPNPDSEEID